MASGRLRFLGLFFALNALLLPFAQAQTQDLLQVWTKAQQRDPILAAAQANRAAQSERVPQARALLLPYITAGTGVEADDIRSTSLDHSNTDKRATWALTLTQPIIDLGLWDTYRASEYIEQSATLAVQQAWQDLTLRVAQAYFNVLAAQDTLKSLDAQKKAIMNQLDAAKRGFELGSATIADTYEAQARLDLINASEIQAFNALQIAQDALASIINERPTELARLQNEVSLPPPQPARLSDWTAQAAQASLEVAQAELGTRLAEKQIDIAQSTHYPTVDFYAQSGSSSDRGTSGPRAGPRSVETTVGLQLSIPLYAGGGISSRVREQTSLLQKSRYELESTRRQAIQTTQAFFSGVVSGLSRVSALQAAEASSRASLEANQTGYEVGVRVNIDVLNAQQQLYETQRALADARYTTLLNGLRLKAASGILTADDIIAINNLLAP
ncbi:MAG: hypothetical protein CML16_10840 [Pusillimonas sp.]|jgi:outer membrane protein|nr:hypothetical protein [Pusillimonas sp.]MBC42732.1 hypothetical protein [Pusillimonas sp.]HCN72843.1 hypothetical protein [Pusillimonas sp.]|tara:strand:- start:52382 stop:53713 length:1332 start_codon:yes stop_codon:yes gene_type:complete